MSKVCQQLHVHLQQLRSLRRALPDRGKSLSCVIHAGENVRRAHILIHE